ncbi:DUF2510 domain-containing protein [Trebonia sp.]|uniref:DUF2510 domain-containing protein n=1 Tax=Trebonia sp. TaxID=2767075 RepID=UPI002619CA50|nr:DUF2510 domain-containing protein [Trebonia sp.]
MDLPPSGWYPDPYRVPGLLRWWDGSRWTHHTHQGDGTDDADGNGADAVQATTVQPTVQPSAVQPTTVQPTTVQPTTVQPTVQLSAVQPTSVQPAAQPTTVQPTTVQPTTVQPGAGLPAVMPPQGPDANGTKVLFLGDDAWTTPGTPGRGGPGDRYGYARAQRRRRMWVAGGLAGCTVAALAAVTLILTVFGRTPATTPAADKTPATPTVARTTPPPSPSPSPSASPSFSTIVDGQSGLSYAQLPSPWQPNCPSGLNGQSFTWTAGEFAIAGQINGGQQTWYGVACSGPLPQQYGYSGVADLDNVTTNLVTTFENTYYSALQPSFQTELSQPVMVSGHAGWEIKFLVTYPNAQAQGLAWSNELAAVVVADLGSGVAPAVFYTSIPGNRGEGNVDTLVSSLQVSVPPQPGGGGSPGDGSPGDDGSPPAGSPNP